MSNLVLLVVLQAVALIFAFRAGFHLARAAFHSRLAAMWLDQRLLIKRELRSPSWDDMAFAIESVAERCASAGVLDDIREVRSGVREDT